MDEEKLSACQVIEQMIAEAKRTGLKLTELTINQAMYDALVLECHPKDPAEIFEVPIKVEDEDGKQVVYH